MSYISCSFICPLALRHPRSFPTRRSSDLPVRVSEPPPCIRDASTNSTSPPAGVQARGSEEHTSELQSPCNVVCRALHDNNKMQFQSDMREMSAERSVIQQTRDLGAADIAV